MAGVDFNILPHVLYCCSAVNGFCIGYNITLLELNLATLLFGTKASVDHCSTQT